MRLTPPKERADGLRQRVIDLIYSGPHKPIESKAAFPAIAWPHAWLENEFRSAINETLELLLQQAYPMEYDGGVQDAVPAATIRELMPPLSPQEIKEIGEVDPYDQ